MDPVPEVAEAAPAPPLPYWEGEIVPEVRTSTLDNGLRVTVVADPDQVLVATQIWVHFGGAHEAPGQRGFAHLFEHLMFAGTERFDEDAFTGWFVRHGGSRNAYTSFDETVFVSEIAPEAHRRVLEMEADRFAHLPITEAALAREQKVVTEELRVRTQNDPVSRVQLALLEDYFGDHPYALTPVGTAEDVANITVADAAAFYDATYRPENLHLIVAGPVRADALMTEIEALFGTLAPGGVPAPEVPPVDALTPPPVLAVSEDLPPVEITAWIYRRPPRSHPDALALEVMDQLLFYGEVDRVREALVERRGRALEAGGFSMTQRQGGATALFAMALPDRTWRRADALMAQTVAELDALHWLDEARLESAKRAMLRRELGAAYASGRIAARRGWAAWQLGDESLADTRIDALRAVTADDVARVWRTWVATAEPTRAHVSPRRIPLVVRLFGWMVP